MIEHPRTDRYAVWGREEIDEERALTVDDATLDRFRATARVVQDLGDAVQDDCLRGGAGRLYLGSLWVEDLLALGSFHVHPRWYTITDTSEYLSDDLDAIERVLCAWALRNGYAVGSTGLAVCPACETPRRILDSGLCVLCDARAHGGEGF
jgi:hypothetical protein